MSERAPSIPRPAIDEQQPPIATDGRTLEGIVIPSGSAEATTPLPDITPTIPTQRVSPENSPRTPLDAESNIDAGTFYTDVEILGSRYPVRRTIKAIGNRRMQAVESVTATWKNVLDTPGKFRLGFIKAIAEGRLNRKQAKYKRVEHLSDKNPLKRWRKRKLEKAQAKYDRASAAYEGRKGRMKDRRDNVKKNFEQRRATYRRELAAKREAALSRKALRHEIRGEASNRLEVAAAVKAIPKEHLERVGRLAATAHKSRQKAIKAHKRRQDAIGHENKAQNAVNENLRLTKEAADGAKQADDNIELLKKEKIPRAKESLRQLNTKLKRLPNDDPTLVNLRAQIRATEDRIARYEEEELPYWEQVARNNRARVLSLRGKRNSLTWDLSLNQRATRRMTSEAQAAGIIAYEHANELRKAVAEITGGQNQINR